MNPKLIAKYLRAKMKNYNSLDSIDTIHRILDISAIGLWELFIDIATGSGSLYCDKNMLKLIELETHLPPVECYQWLYDGVDDTFKEVVGAGVGKIISCEEITFESEYPWHGKNTIRYVRCSGTLISYSEKQIHIAGYHQDISDHYHTKILLQQQLANFKMGCEIGNCAVFELQYSSGINQLNAVHIIANTIFSNMFGLPTIKVNTTDWTIIGSYFESNMRKKWCDLLDYSSWQVDFKVDCQFTFHIAKGSIKWLHLTYKIIKDTDAKLRLIGYLQDITNQKEYEVLLEESKESAESANMAKSMFLANMSHEIRTPMNAVINFAKFMQDTELTAQQSDYIQKIHMSGSLMLSILNDILDFSKMEANKLALEFRPLDMREEVQTITSLVSQWAEEKDISFVGHLSADIPPYIVGDSLRLRQVLINLLSNAVKFTPIHGKITLEITKTRTIDDFVWITFLVSDDGIGMTEEQLSLLFTAFTQADSSITRRFGGTGLGLTICKMLVNLMGGNILVKSTFNVGTVFSIELPFKHATQEEIATAKLEAQNEFDNYTFPELHCLIVEDNIINQQVILALLSSLEVFGSIANNGQEAIDMFMGSDDFDCIFMDIQMPVMDGYTATQKLRKIDSDKAKNIPIFALTAHAMRGDNTKSISCGMNTHITKPLNKLEICQTLAEYFPQFVKIKEKNS